MGRQHPVKVQLLTVPNCPLTAKVRRTLDDCSAKAQLHITVEELVGDYHSPTLLVDGFDVTGRPPAAAGQAACRLDLPNDEQISAAIRGLSVLACEDVVDADIQAAAFKTLLRTAEHVKAEILGRDMGRRTDEITTSMRRLQREAHIQVDNEGFIVGAGGLSLAPARHELSINGRKFWAWCAFDVIGIFAGLQASGFARTNDPSTSESLVLNFVEGVPQDVGLHIFMADLSVGDSVCEDWCSKVYFFRSKLSAEAWLEANGVTGSIISITNAVAAAREAWRRYLIQGKDL